MKISPYKLHCAIFALAFVNGALCIHALYEYKYLLAALSGTAALMSFWNTRFLLDFWLTRFFLRRAAKKAFRRLEQMRKELEQQKQNEGKE